MRNIEQAGLFTGVQVFLEHPQRVLDRHGEAGERHHARAKLQVQAMQRGVL
ncbi:hypothetical protein D3C77_659930 [compost metagenome]